MGGDCRRGCTADVGAVSAGQGERSESGALLHRHCADRGVGGGFHGLQEEQGEGVGAGEKKKVFYLESNN